MQPLQPKNQLFFFTNVPPLDISFTMHAGRFFPCIAFLLRCQSFTWTPARIICHGSDSRHLLYKGVLFCLLGRITASIGRFSMEDQSSPHVYHAWRSSWSRWMMTTTSITLEFLFSILRAHWPPSWEECFVCCTYISDMIGKSSATGIMYHIEATSKLLDLYHACKMVVLSSMDETVTGSRHT
jgi:hypothetical protein